MVANPVSGLLKRSTKKNFQTKTGILLVPLLVNSTSDWTSLSTTWPTLIFWDLSPNRINSWLPDSLLILSTPLINSSTLNILLPTHQSSLEMAWPLMTYWMPDPRKLLLYPWEMYLKWRIFKVRLPSSPTWGRLSMIALLTLTCTETNGRLRGMVTLSILPMLIEKTVKVSELKVAKSARITVILKGQSLPLYQRRSKTLRGT